MTEEMIEDSIQIVKQSLYKYSIEKDIAQYIKN